MANWSSIASTISSLAASRNHFKIWRVIQFLGWCLTYNWWCSSYFEVTDSVWFGKSFFINPKWSYLGVQFSECPKGRGTLELSGVKSNDFKDRSNDGAVVTAAGPPCSSKACCRFKATWNTLLTHIIWVLYVNHIIRDVLKILKHATCLAITRCRRLTNLQLGQMQFWYGHVHLWP